MKHTIVMALAVLAAAVAPAVGADDQIIQRLVTCQDSWLDWTKSDPAKVEAFRKHFESGFTHHDSGGYYVPNRATTVAGLRVLQVFPESVGMGVGFSVTVDAPFAKARAAFERVLGKKLTKCDASDNMRTCELEIAEKRTFTLMAQDKPPGKTTLAGCYYYYEK